MDPDKERRQSLKIIISEIFMVISVVFVVVILALLVSGYWINSDFQVERQGLLQISSVPSGATVEIDGDSSWFQRTNTSKVLSSGEHSVILTKDGYDSWSKKVRITEGLLYRLHYPRLFLQGTVAEELLDVEKTTFSTFSPEGDVVLLSNSTTSWQLVNLEDEDPRITSIDVSDLLIAPSLQGQQETADIRILSADWDQDGSHVLMSIEQNGLNEWILLDIHNVDKSINLTKTFDSEFSQVQILDHSSNNLLAVIDGSLRKIDVSGRSLSSILVQNVTHYDHYDTNEIVFSAVDTGTKINEKPSHYVGILKINDGHIDKLLDLDNPAQVAIGKFYDDKYIVILQNSILDLYKYNDFEKKASYTLGFIPDTMGVGHNGEFIIAYSGKQIATIDLETESDIEWSADSDKFGWIDDDMIYAVDNNNDLTVYDYDGLNRRIVAHNAAVGNPATITAEKWLHFFSNGHLMRQQIAD